MRSLNGRAVSHAMQQEGQSGRMYGIQTWLDVRRAQLLAEDAEREFDDE